MKVLVVEDDRVLADLIAFTLRREGYQVQMAYDGEKALQKWRSHRPDIIVLDLNLPKVDGFTVCERIRSEDTLPIIMLTVRGEEDDIIRGLTVGADDYILKPFSPRQLVARMQSVLRRAGKTQTTAIYEVGDLVLDSIRRELWIDQSAIGLTSLENRLLRYMMINKGHILSHEALIGYVWGPEGGDRDMLRQLVRRLRRKIEIIPEPTIFIENVPGRGYGLMIQDI
jgi:DNA-binding response OmpR family regulator